MSNTIFKEISLGQTLPINNIHAVSVSFPKFQDIIDYEEEDERVFEKIKSAYPRFLMHPYLKLLANFIKNKYKISDDYEILVVSSKKAVKIISDRYFINNKIKIDEDFGVILVQQGTSQLQKVLSFIQHVGCNLSSRFAQDYLLRENIIKNEHQEVLVEKNLAYDTLLNNLSTAYSQPKENICLAPSGMNAIYSVLKGLKKIQDKNSRTTILQLGWLYLDTMNIIKNHYDFSELFYDIRNLDLVETYLKTNANKISCIITEFPTNPLLKTVDIKRLSKLCKKYNIPLIIDSTLATPYNIDLKPYADILIESLTKYACGNADVLMGCFIINETSKLSFCKEEFFKHADLPYIKDIQRLAYETSFYEKRMKILNKNTYKLIKYLENAPYIDKIYHCLNEKNYCDLMKNEKAVGGLISLTFKKEFQKVYDHLNFPKGPSLGTEFTLLMPYVYLAHYDLLTNKKGQEFLQKNDLPIDLLRVAVGCEDINEIIKEFERLVLL